jgi:Transposase and inactivated derivatives, IS30 family
MRRFPPFHDTPDPVQRRHNIVQLHAEGWSVASIAEYLAVSKQTVYTTLKRWVQERRVIDANIVQLPLPDSDENQQQAAHLS